MSKMYIDYMEEITSEELYEGLLAYGIFTEKLPPVFTAESFYQYCERSQHNFRNKCHGYIYYESMRDINIPRQLAIPNPMAYQKQCECLRENWEEIKKHFKDQTLNDAKKISRIHIRKQKNSKSIFKMNYKDWRKDGSPEPDLLLGARYLVYADISNCFPSMYTHALPWALVGKDEAKRQRNSGWFNKLDKTTRNLKNGETHGFLIGPHSSNLISEIILTAIDKTLTVAECKRFFRNIDDYTCYVESYEEAQKFLKCLNRALREYDLSLNHKKTKIEELPVGLTKRWVHQLNAVDFIASNGKVNYKGVRAYLDKSVVLMSENKESAAIINYAIKVLAHQELTKNAEQYCLKIIMHYAIIYPYLVPLLDENVFMPFHATAEQIEEFSQVLYDESMKLDNFESAIYAIFFSLKYNFEIKNVAAKNAIENEDCMLKIFTWLYLKENNNENGLNDLEEHARALVEGEVNEGEFDKYWLFLYEVLKAEDLPDEWRALKRANVTFIKSHKEM